METTMLPTMLSTMLPITRPWSVPAASVAGRSTRLGAGTAFAAGTALATACNAPTVPNDGTAPDAGTYGIAPSVVVPGAVAKRGSAVAESFGPHAADTADVLVPAAARQAGPDARTVTTLDPGSPPRDARLL